MFLSYYTIYESHPGHLIILVVLSSQQSSHHHGHLVLVVIVISSLWLKHKTVQAAQTITFNFQMFLFYYPVQHGHLLLDTLYAYPDASSLLLMSCHCHLWNLIVVISQSLSHHHLIIVIILLLFYHHCLHHLFTIFLISSQSP